MNRPVSVLFALALVPAALFAQTTGDHTNLVLSIFGGVSAGHSLWSLPRQPICVLQGAGPNYAGCAQSSSGDVADTFALARDVASSVLLGAGVTVFPNPYIGFQGQIYYLGLSYDDRCTLISPPYQPDSENKNHQMCQNFGATSASASAVSFVGGVTLRASPRHAISPYLSASVGLTSYSGGTLAVSGQFTSAATDPTTGQPLVIERTIVVDTVPKTTSWTVQLGAGFTAAMSPGYQLRFELRDAILPLERLIGPANDFGQAPHETKIYHHIALTVGLDIVLEHRRSHRY
jgi:hypothetical protein